VGRALVAYDAAVLGSAVDTTLKNAPERYRDRRDCDEIRGCADAVASAVHTLAAAR
jgi:hypothetical protein